MNTAYQEINWHRRSLSNTLEISQQHNLTFDFDRTLEHARIQELMEYIRKLEDAARESSSSRAQKSSTKFIERVGRTRKVAVKVPLGKTTHKTSPSSNSSSSS